MRINVRMEPKTAVFLSYAASSLSGMVKSFLPRIFFASVNAKSAAKK